MGWLDAPEDKRRQHLQMIATGNIRDVDRIHERNRRRGINFMLWFFMIVSGFMGYNLFNTVFRRNSYYFLTFALIMLISLIIRYGLHRKVNFRRSSGSKSWEKLKFAPSWVHKKMKRRRTHFVNGEHYQYKKEGNIYYRKLK